MAYFASAAPSFAQPSSPYIPPTPQPYYAAPVYRPYPYISPPSPSPYGPPSLPPLPNPLPQAPMMDEDPEQKEDEPELLIACHNKKMAYAPGSMMRTYDDAIAYVKEAFPALACVKPSEIQLYVDTDQELVRVPSPAWASVFPTLTPSRFSSAPRYVFVELEGAPSGLPSFPFHMSIQSWFAPTHSFPPPPQVYPLAPPSWAAPPPTTTGSNASTESLTVRPARNGNNTNTNAADHDIAATIEDDGPPPPFSPREGEEEPKKKRRSLWGMLKAMFGAGKKRRNGGVTLSEKA